MSGATIPGPGDGSPATGGTIENPVDRHPGHGKSENSGNGHHASQDHASVLTGKLPAFPVRADAGTTASRLRGLWFAKLLQRIDYGNSVSNSLFFQQFSHRAGHPAVTRPGDVSHPDECGVQLHGRPHAGDDRKAPLPAPCDEMNLAGEMVDCVQYIVMMPRQKKIATLLGIELTVGDDLGGGVDTPQPLGHDLGLGLAHRPIKGMKLPVNISEADIVEIDNGYLPDAGAADRFGGRAADPAQAKNRHGRVPQPSEPFSTYKEFRSGESMQHIRFVLRRGQRRCRLRSFCQLTPAASSAASSSEQTTFPLAECGELL